MPKMMKRAQIESMLKAALADLEAAGRTAQESEPESAAQVSARASWTFNEGFVCACQLALGIERKIEPGSASNISRK
jgi:hypothetical protein